jgi:hypothetical protein
MAVGLASITAHAVLVPVLLRLFAQRSPMVVHLGSAAGLHVAATVGAAVTMPDFNYWPEAAVHWFGFMLYLYGYQAINKSISLRILRGLVLERSQQLTQVEILHRFVYPQFIDRINILVTTGQVREHNGLYEVTAGGTNIAGKICRLQRLFGITTCGLYSAPRELKKDGRRV